MQVSMDRDRYLTINEVSERLRIPATRVEQLCREGSLRGSVRSAADGTWLIPLSALGDWMLPSEQPIATALETYLQRTAVLVAAAGIASASLFALLHTVVTQDWTAYVLWAVVLNVGTFAVYAYDKYKAMSGGTRIAEIALHVLTLSGGLVGAWVGTLLLQHKISKPTFRATLIATTLVYVFSTLLIFTR